MLGCRRRLPPALNSSVCCFRGPSLSLRMVNRRRLQVGGRVAAPADTERAAVPLARSYRSARLVSGPRGSASARRRRCRPLALERRELRRRLFVVVVASRKDGVLLCPAGRRLPKKTSVAVEAELAAVSFHHGLARIIVFFHAAASDRAVDGCGAGELPVGFAASELAPVTAVIMASASKPGAALVASRLLGCPAPSNAVCESSLFSEGPRVPG